MTHRNLNIAKKANVRTLRTHYILNFKFDMQIHSRVVSHG